MWRNGRRAAISANSRLASTRRHRSYPAVARAIFDFSQRYPDVRIELLELSPGAQVAALVGEDIDIGFMRSPTPPMVPPGIAVTRVLEERLFIAMRSEHHLARKPSLSFPGSARRADDLLLARTEGQLRRQFP